MSKQKELKKAIVALESQRAALGNTAVDAAIAGIKAQLAVLDPVSHARERRKQVTVLFADVSGFTAMIETMDAEDAQETINALWRRVDQVILAHNGRIDKHIGDAVMALWGVDEAREDDPEQAIRAALAMQTAVQAFAAGHDHPLQMRVGLNTGPVLLGEVGATAEFTAIGDTVNTAARLEQAAPVGGVLISHETYRHVRGVFDVAPQAPLRAKGKSEPLQAYVVNRAKTRAFRTHTRGVEGVETRMVGRDAELGRLKEIWETAVSTPQTTLVAISGDAGVGKSRLLYEFEEWLDLQPARLSLFKSRSAAQTRGVPYFLLRDLLAARLGIRESDPIGEVRRTFTAGVGEQLPGDGEMKAHILGQWLGYDFGHSPHVAAIGDDAEQLQNRGLLYLGQFLRAMAERRPLLIFIEDIHWADAPSLDAILRLVRRRAELPLLVVALARPLLFERRPAWRALATENEEESEGLSMKEPAYHLVALDPLPAAANHQLLAEILQKMEPIPQPLFALIAARAAGNPFYMEELVKMLIDDGVILTDAARWRVDLNRLHQDRVPGTLTGVLQARLDRLAAEERVTLQRASVVGRVFWDRAVRRLGGDPERIRLTPLQKRELIYRQRETTFANTNQFLFKHDLLRDVTYETVLKKARRLYHERAADWLVEAAAANGRTDEYAAVIADHYQAAKQTGRAAHWYGRAGQDAAARYAHAEAIHYLSLALDLTPDDDHAARYPLLLAREKAYDMQGARDVQEEDLQALAALAPHLSVTEQATVALRQANYGEVTSDQEQAILHAQTAIELGRQGGAEHMMAAGHWTWGNTLLQQSQYPAAREHLEKGVQLAQAAGDQRQMAYCLDALGWVVYWQADYESAKNYLKQSLAIFRDIGDRRGEALSLGNLGGVADEEGDTASAKAYIRQALAIQRDTGWRQEEGGMLNDLGMTVTNEGNYALAQELLKQALTIFREIDSDLGKIMSLMNLGRVAVGLGDYPVATDYYDQAWAIIRKLDHPEMEGGYYRELGEVALAQADISLAENCYEQAAAIHQELNQTHYLVEDWAGLAQVKLAQDDEESARYYAQQVLNYLQTNPRLDGAIDRMRAFRFTWEVLTALGQTREANEVLALAAQVMQDYLDKNSDPVLQEMYLRQPHHQVLWAAWVE